MNQVKRLYTVIYCLSVCLFITIVGGVYYISTMDVKNSNIETLGLSTALTRVKTPVSTKVSDTDRLSLAHGDAPSAKNLKSVDTLLAGLKSRLESKPEDMQGWVLLAKSYHHLNRWEEAGQAYKKAKALGYTGTAKALGTSAKAANDGNANFFNTPNYSAMFKIIGESDKTAK